MKWIKNSKICISWKFLAVILFFVAILAYGGVFVFKAKDNKLSKWEDTSATKKAIIKYVSEVTDKNSENYIPVEDRIAVFDADGTYYCERGNYLPNYLARYIAAYRLENDPDFSLSAEEIAISKGEFITQEQQIQIFAGLDTKNFDSIVNDFKEEQ